MTEDVFEVLRAAVNLARHRGIRRVVTLRARLKELYPGREADIQEALLAWAKYVQD